jgi:hypothetical protein
MTMIHAQCPFRLENSECPCKRSLDSWNTSEPPEFLCQETMRASVKKWVNDRADEVFASLTTSGAGLQATSLTIPEGLNPRLSSALENFLYVAKDELLSRWPFPLGSRLLAFVLEQWVQEAPNETLANLIDNQPTWSLAIERLRARWGFAIRNSPDIDGLSEQLTTDITGLLQQCRIPVAPANIGYGLAKTVGDQWAALPHRFRKLIVTRECDNRPLPARGVRLSTLAFASLVLVPQDEAGPTEDPQPAWLMQPHAQIGMTGEVAHVTEPFVREHLAPVLLKHRQFVQALSAHPFRDLSNLRRAQPTSYKSGLTGAETEFDYVEEARREVEKQKDALLLLEPEWRFEISIEKILDRVAKRVAQRRERSGMPTTPPKGWRQQAKHMIRYDLDL